MNGRGKGRAGEGREEDGRGGDGEEEGVFISLV